MTEKTVPTIAYFSAEYAIADDLPIYAGGLGILAADIVFEAGIGTKPFYAMGLVYHNAFTGDDSDQRSMVQRLEANDFVIAVNDEGKKLIVEVAIADRMIKLQAWNKSWGPSTLILLDSHLPENTDADRAICDRLYASDLKLQLAQELCLGFGGVAMLEAMHVSPDMYHFNEGHTALGALAVTLRKRSSDQTLQETISSTKHALVGTKHTILAGAGILLDWNSVEEQLTATLAQYDTTIAELKSLADKGNGDYSDAKLLLALVGRSSGVSEIHVKAELREHSNSPLIAITNGINTARWIAPNLDRLPSDMTDELLWEHHTENRSRLIEFVAEETGQTLDKDRLTVVWARRMTAYKQPQLLVSDLKKLAALIHDTDKPVQFIVAGKPNPVDTVGIQLLQQIIDASSQHDLVGSFAYLPHYNPASARILVRGADVWLNTPIQGYEACGTSGMKASLNGAVQLSTSDGWIDEVDTDSIGWILPNEDSAESLYSTLGETIAPLFYTRDESGLPKEWIAKMRNNMDLIRKDFSAKRMLGDYYDKLYSGKETA
jgi:starch phosphorylase